MEQDVPPDQSFYAQPAGPATRPCLFDLDADEGEREDISGDEPEVLAALWADLNAASLTQVRSPCAFPSVPPCYRS